MKVDLSCPIELWAYSLPTAEKPVLSLTFFNLSDKTISSIQVTVTTYDEGDGVLSRRVERPMALDALGRKSFTVLLPSNEMDISAVNLEIDKAWFSDGSEWRRQQNVRLVEYVPNELPPNRKLEQLRYVAGDDAVGFPSDQGNSWICVCGRVNGAEEETCRRCDRNREDVFDRFSDDAVQAVIDAREYELEETARMAREEASRQEFMRQDRAKRKKRVRRTRSIFITTTLVIAVMAYLFIMLGLPELKYQSGLSALAAGDYTTARQSFVDLLDYRDAPSMVKETELRQASADINSGIMSRIDDALAALDALEDYPGAQELAQEATYQKGRLYLTEKNYAKASETMKTISGYRDADAIRNEADYEIATLSLQAGNYDDAAKRFTALGDYSNAAAMAKEAVYLPAMELKNGGSYNEAAELFSTIIGYKDVYEQRQQALYHDALRALSVGEYDYAAERFTLLGNYEDADDQKKLSIYMAASAARDAGRYEHAVTMFTTIVDYEDAKEQIKICTYLPAKALMTEQSYDEAAVLFLQILDYQDSQELYNQCLYLPAVDAVNAGDYVTAISLFEKIPEYSDVPKRLQQASYDRAAQLESEGDLAGAILAFDTLGEYSDAPTRANAARYAQAQEAFDAGHFSLAAEGFTALGKYSDAATRVKECAYELAMFLFDAERYADAYEALMAIEEYSPAVSRAREAAYLQAEKLIAAGDLAGASEAFRMAGQYSDAAERQKQSLYQLAIEKMQNGAYEEAGELFDGLGSYSDARSRRNESNDLWLSEKREEADALFDEGAYQAVVDLLRGLDMAGLPKAYADLQTTYYEANMKIARQHIAENRALDAYGYLIAVDGYKDSSTLLDKNIYRILGTWETRDGSERYAFYLNGTANLNGERGFFNMVQSNPYGIFFGESNDTETMVRALSYTSGTANSLRLLVDETQKSLNLVRVNEPEVSETSDSEGSVVVGGAETQADEGPVVDIIQISGVGNDTLPQTAGDLENEEAADNAHTAQ